MTWKAPQWRQRHEADSHRLWLRAPTYISGVLTKRNSVRCFSLIGDIKEELALISSSQCKQRFFGVSSNYYLKWWYTFYDWNSVDIISPDIYQKENGEVHVGWSKGDQPIFFFSFASMKFSLVWLLRFDRVYSMLSDSPSRSRGVPSLYHWETKRRHPRKR